MHLHLMQGLIHEVPSCDCSALGAADMHWLCQENGKMLIEDVTSLILLQGPAAGSEAASTLGSMLHGACLETNNFISPEATRDPLR